LQQITKPYKMEDTQQHVSGLSSTGTSPKMNAVYQTSSIVVLRTPKPAGTAPPPPPPASPPPPAQTERPSIGMVSAKQVLQIQYEMWGRGELCDVILETADGEVLAHRVILAAYVNQESRDTLTQPGNPQVAIDLREFPRDAVLPIVHYMYTYDLTVPDRQLGGTLGASRRLGCDAVTDKCVTRLHGYSVDTALFYHDVARQHGLTDLQEQITTFICNRFVDVSRTRDFMWLCVDDLVAFLSSDISVPNELDLFHALVNWVEYSKQKRQEYIPVLMRCVQFTRLSPEVIVDHAERNFRFLLDIPECLQMIHQAMCFHALKLSGSSLAAAYEPAYPRRSTVVALTPGGPTAALNPRCAQPSSSDEDFQDAPNDIERNHSITCEERCAANCIQRNPLYSKVEPKHKQDSDSEHEQDSDSEHEQDSDSEDE